MDGAFSLIPFVCFTEETSPGDQGFEIKRLRDGRPLLAKNDLWVWVGLDVTVLRSARNLKGDEEKNNRSASGPKDEGKDIRRIAHSLQQSSSVMSWERGGVAGLPCPYSFRLQR